MSIPVWGSWIDCCALIMYVFSLAARLGSLIAHTLLLGLNSTHRHSWHCVYTLVQMFHPLSFGNLLKHTYLTWNVCIPFSSKVLDILWSLAITDKIPRRLFVMNVKSVLHVCTSWHTLHLKLAFEYTVQVGLMDPCKFSLLSKFSKYHELMKMRNSADTAQVVTLLCKGQDKDLQVCAL